MSATFILLALDSPFSRPVLQTLLDAGHLPAALLLPNPARAAPLASLPPLANRQTNQLLSVVTTSQDSLSQTAAQHNIPLLTLGNLRHTDALAALRAYQPDFLVTACFPRLLPAEMLALPRVGCLNLHPSLLPAYRGPEPLFWQFYFGETHTGVTLHWMDEGADTGDLLAQAEVLFPDGISLAQAEKLMAHAGGTLLCRALSAPDQLPRVPQPARGASAHSRPTADALAIPTTWEARRAFNFLRAAEAWGPLEVVDAGGDAAVAARRLRVWRAVGWDEGSGTGTAERGEKRWDVQFVGGRIEILGV
ncbi:MAG: hypothetical protein H6636_08060 [Anaerolineales bacterium]|nr:hypothetical protein [Anaerolineales bacterium]